MAYHVELIRKKELEEHTIPSMERKITKLERDLSNLNRIKPELLTEREKSKLESKSKKVALLKNIIIEANRVILDKEYKKEATK